jgi:hypothetical protein
MRDTIFLVKFIEFLPDNYQGGSGKHFNRQIKVEIPSNATLLKARLLINESVMTDMNQWTDSKREITSISMF